MSEPDPLRARLAEAIAGDYALLQELGRGGMASVHLARDLVLDRLVAIKVMAPELAAVPEMAERFVQEARIAAALTHPHIIPIHAVRRRGDLLYIVMRYVAGRPLDDILRSAGPLPPALVRAILTQVGAALEAAHRAGIVHRDIKPANILIDERGDAVVADFGIARLTEQPGRTQVGQTVGTPAYMSPEQCAGAPLSGAADQYALGVVAYELLTGTPPYVGDGLVQVVWKMVHEPVVPLAQRRPDCAGPIATAVHRMLAPQATDRWPSVADAVAALGPLTLAADDPQRQRLIALATQRAPDATAQGAPTRPSHGSAPTRPSQAVSGAPTVATAALASSAASARSSAVAALSLPYEAAVLCLDDAHRLDPRAVDADGQPLPDARLAWSSTDPDTVHVDADGVVRARRPGTATILVRADEALARMTLVVTRLAPRQLRIVAPPEPLEVGDRLTLTVGTGDPPGALPHPRLVQWSSSAPAICAVDATGRLSVVAEGSVEITARVGAAVATKTLKVVGARVSAVRLAVPTQRLAMGTQLQLHAAAANTRGHEVPGLPVRWEVSDPSVAAISPEGLLTARRTGQVLVAAKAGGRVSTARVQITE